MGGVTSQWSSQARLISGTSQTAGRALRVRFSEDAVLSVAGLAKTISARCINREDFLRTIQEEGQVKSPTTSFSFKTLPKRFKNM